MQKIPYGRQTIDEDDVQLVTEALMSDFLTTGPMVGRFERAVADFCGVAHGVAVANGTAALHGCMFALGIGEGDEVIVPPMTFAATANCVLYVGGTPVFADVTPGGLLIDPAEVRRKITPRTRAVIAVDYAGQPCDWAALRVVADEFGLPLIADACHAIGGMDQGHKVGALADLTVFSFHPVKHVATGEGGMIVTNQASLADRARLFRNHGITTDAAQREASGDWYYEMVELGFNVRLTDIQAALGVSQMAKLPDSLARRRDIAAWYGKRFAGTAVSPLELRGGVEHAYHLYVVRVPERDKVFKRLREAGVMVQVHYIPVHLHPYYKKRLGTEEGQLPVAEAAYGEIVSLPMFPALEEADLERVADELLKVVG